MDFRSLSKGADLKYPSGARLIITDGQTWEQFWTQAIEGRERPDVDFGQEMVIAVLMQESPNGCLRVQVTDVTRGENSTATVHVDVQGPPVCELAVMGQAYHIIAMPAADVVLFQEARV